MLAIASTTASSPYPASPISGGRSVCWTKPDRMKNAFAPSTAPPPRPATRAVSDEGRPPGAAARGASGDEDEGAGGDGESSGPAGRWGGPSGGWGERGSDN